MSSFLLDLICILLLLVPIIFILALFGFGVGYVLEKTEWVAPSNVLRHYYRSVIPDLSPEKGIQKNLPDIAALIEP